MNHLDHEYNYEPFYSLESDLNFVTENPKIRALIKHYLIRYTIFVAVVDHHIPYWCSSP